MKIKNIIVEIRPLETSLNEFKETYKKISSGKSVKKKELISFESIEVMIKILTPKRLGLLKLIKQKKPSSIYELAKLANRDSKSVNTDIKILTDLGIIKSRITENKRHSIMPHVNFDRIRLEIPI